MKGALVVGDVQLGGGGAVKPDFGGWLEDVDGGYHDARGQDEMTVEVGAAGNGDSLAFSPAGLWIDPGTTVLFEWTGRGGAHNVLAEGGPADLDSGEAVQATGVQYEHTFRQGGITKYVCEPHGFLGMKGAIAVGDVPTTGTRTEVAVGPGGEFVFEPGTDEPLRIQSGTTVEFVWESDNHSIAVEDQPDDADWDGHETAEDAGFTHSYTFTVTGEYEYYCRPHRAAGMVAVIEVVQRPPLERTSRSDCR